MNVWKYLLCLSLSLAKLGAESSEAEDSKLGQELSDWETRLEYARLLSYLKKYPESAAQYEKLLAAKPDSEVARYELARIFYYQQNYRAALETLSQLPDKLSKGIDKEQVALLYADIFLALKEYPKAAVIFKKYVALHPEDLQSKYKLAELLSWQKQYDEALDLFEEILSKRPQDIQVRRKYAIVLMWQGNFETAAAEMQKTLPDD